MKLLFFISTIILFVACDKEYYPSENTYKDPDLCYTWVRTNLLESAFLFKDNIEPQVDVFTEKGYISTVSLINNNEKYESLEGIWFAEKLNSENRLTYNRYHEQKRFRNGMYNHSFDYYLSEGKDTLFRKREGENKWDTLIKFNYQLMYDGPTFIKKDSI